MDAARRVEQLISPAIEAMGYDIVRVQISGNKNVVMQIMAERQDEAGMTVDDCAAISREVSALLDVEDPVGGPYSLEVSSPGIDRPLVKLNDFERYAGFDAKIETTRPVDGRKRFKGTLVGVLDGNVRLRLDAGDIDLPHDEIRNAKLLLTDALIEAATQSTVPTQ